MGLYWTPKWGYITFSFHLIMSWKAVQTYRVTHTSFTASPYNAGLANSYMDMNIYILSWNFYKLITVLTVHFQHPFSEATGPCNEQLGKVLANSAGVLEQITVIAHGSSVSQSPRQLLQAHICTSVPEDFLWNRGKLLCPCTQRARSPGNQHPQKQLSTSDEQKLLYKYTRSSLAPWVG